MNSFQMAWRSVIRKPVKSILLLLVVFVISLFLLSGMASKNASVAMQDTTRQAIGAGFILEGNEADRSRRVKELSEKIGEKDGSLDGYHQEKLESSAGETWFSWTDNSFETLKAEDIEKIAQVPGISDYNITTAVTAVNPVNFERIEDADTDQSGDALGVSLIGNRDMSMDSNVLSGNVTIKEGRMVKIGDLDVCVVSEELAEKNHLSLGDRLQVNDYHDREGAEVYEAEIIGIYQVKQEIPPYMYGDTYRSENVIFTDLRFPEKAEGSKDGPLFQKAYFKVGDVDQYETVREEIKKAELDWKRYDLIDNNGNLDTMSSNFKDLEKVSQILVWAAAGASFIILLLVFAFWMKSRTKEAGILLALGTSKIKILGQILTEALMAAAVGILLSFTIAPGVSKAAAAYLVQQQIQQSEEQEILDQGKVSKPYEEPEQTVTGIHAEITPDIMAAGGLGVAVLTAISVGAAGILILRRNPKDILRGMD